MYLHNGKLYTVTDEPGQPTAGRAAQSGSWLRPLSRLFGFGWLGLAAAFPATFLLQRRRRSRR